MISPRTWLIASMAPLRWLLSLLMRLGESLRHGGRCAEALWSRCSHFLQNVLVGGLVALLLTLGQNTAWVRDIEDWAMDWMNRLQVDTSGLAGAGGYTFIDMDEAAFRAWDEPYHVPRDKLLALLRYAVESQARAIVVDVDLSRPGLDVEAAKAFRDYIGGLPEGAPPILLMRTFGALDSRARGLAPLRKAWFDDGAVNPAVRWVQPHFEVDGSDRNIRRWRLVEAGCLDGKRRYTASPQLRVALLAGGEDQWPVLKQRLESAADTACEKADARPKALSIEVAGQALKLGATDSRQRVIYSFSSRLPLGDERLGYRRLPAGLVTGASGGLAADPVRDRIVIIGASYQASHDVHPTPVGDMPGSLIILNAIKSLQQFGQLQGPPWWLKLCIEAALILFMAYAFARFSSLGGVLLTGGLAALVLVPVSFFVFRYGIWVDMALPILGMQANQVWADYRELVEAKRRLRELESMESDG